MWVKKFGSGTNNTWAEGFDIDSLENIYITGRFSNIVDFDPGPGVFNVATTNHPASWCDIFVLKLNSNGDLNWVKNIGGDRMTYSNDIHITDSNNVLITGNFENTVDFDPGLDSTFLYSDPWGDAFILSLDSAGDFSWVKQIGNIGSGLIEKGIDISSDQNNNIYATGFFVGTVDFNPNTSIADTFYLSSNGGSDIYILKLTSTGKFIRAISFGGNSGESISGIKIDNSTSSVYTTGFFRNTVDFDPGPSIYNLISNGNEHVYILKLDTSLSFIWAKNLEGSVTSKSRPYDITLDNFSNILISGEYFKQIDFDPGIGTHFVSSNIMQNMFFLKLDINGNYLTSKQFGSDIGFGYRAYGIAVDNEQKIYLAGLSSDTVDFDPGIDTLNLYGSGVNHDGGIAFIAKFDPCTPSFGSMNIVNYCGPYTGPSGKIYTIAGTYIDVVDNFIGCDSNITLTITFGQSTGFIAISTCNHYISPSGNYNWIQNGNYLDTIPNHLGCDSVITVNLLLHDEYFSSLIFACDSFLYLTQPGWNYTSGWYRDTLTNAWGCKDYYHDTMFVTQTGYGTNSMIGCANVLSLSGNQIWTSSGVYLDTIQTQFYCDSILTTTVTVNSNSYDTLNPIVCDFYQSPLTFNTYNSSGFYHETVPNSSGCDSNLYINLTILQSTIGVTDSIWNCHSTSSYSGNQTWNVSGTYLDTIYNGNQYGCDSIFNVIVEIPIQSNYTIVPAFACSTYTSNSGNQIWTSSGTYRDTLLILNSYGCDSVIDIQLTIGNSSKNITTWTCSNSFISPSGKVWTLSGLHYDTIPNHLGCDSMITYYISIDISKAAIIQSNDTLFASAPNWLFGIPSGLIKFQWLSCNGPSYFPLTSLDDFNTSYVINSSGNYRLRLQAQEGSFVYCEDTTACIAYYLVGTPNFNNDQSVKISPNPTKGISTITFSENQQFISYKLFDISGRKIREEKLYHVDFFDIDMNEMDNGIYLLHFESENINSIKKLIKEE